MNTRFPAQPFELRSEFDEATGQFETYPDAYESLELDEAYEDEEIDIAFESEQEAGPFTFWPLKLFGGARAFTFKPTPVEVPGGGRVQDKTPPRPADLVTVTGVGGKQIQLHRLAAEAWKALVTAARADGFQAPLLLPISGYRSPQHQEKLWRDALAKYDSPEEARKWVAPPGGSAHQTGRAIDFYLGGKNSSANVKRLRTLAAYKWLVANAQRFGFYPYPREPWHWEYNPPAAQQFEAYPESYEILDEQEAYEDEGTDISAENELEFEPFGLGWPVSLLTGLATSLFPSSAPALGGPKVPAGYRPVKRKGVLRGLARYGGDRVDRLLKEMRAKGLVSVLDEDIDTFQRIANVETSGLIQGLNTWDSAVVSIGFMQWTLQFGELQRWIRRASAVFRRYGIEVDDSRSYLWKSGKQPAIKGAATKDELRWDGWAERFYLAGLDPDIIAAEVELGVVKLQEQLNSLKRRLPPDDFALFKTHYDRSLPIRGLYQEAYNNLPAAALSGAVNAVRSAKQLGTVSADRFLTILQDAIRKAYLDRNDNGENVIRKTLSGAQF